MLEHFTHVLFFVSTHSRLKAAGKGNAANGGNVIVSTHSRLKAAGNVL